MENFLTLQGEGFHQGRLAYFIRLAGCDVGCVWCDPLILVVVVVVLVVVLLVVVLVISVFC